MNHGRVARPRDVFYGWWIAFAGAGNGALILGVTVFGFGVFIDPIRDDLHWSLAALTVGFSVRSFQTGLLAPVVGVLLDRIGPRRMSVIGVCVVSGGLLLMSQMQEVWHFYVTSLVVALGTSMAGITSYSAALVRGFHRSRGRAMGVLFAGNGLGYAMAPVMAALIAQYGWRAALVVAAVAILAAGLPLATVIRPRPEDMGLLPDGDTAEATPAAPRARAAQRKGCRSARRCTRRRSICSCSRSPSGRPRSRR
jgi:MFS family permease